MFDINLEQTDLLPPGLDDMAPGPVLAAFVSAIDPDELNGYQLVLVLKARARLISHLQAAQAHDMAELAHRPYDRHDSPPQWQPNIDEFCVDEVGAALSLTRRAADTQLGTAVDLVERLPQVWEALWAGRIDLARAWVISERTGHLPDQGARQVADKVLEKAERQTTGQLAARTERAAMSIDHDGATRRYRQGLADRKLVGTTNPDGTSNLSAYSLPAERAAAAFDHVDRLARAAKTSDDPRTLDQIRADTYLDLLLEEQTMTVTPQRPVVDITVDLATLAGLGNEPGEIPGWGPVIADVARQVVDAQRAGEWRVTVTDHLGQLVCSDVTRRRPTRTLRRHIEATWPTCVFPGCRAPSRRCDVDHTVAHAAGGPTCTHNLEPHNLESLCRHHPHRQTPRLLDAETQRCWPPRLDQPSRPFVYDGARTSLTSGAAG